MGVHGKIYDISGKIASIKLRSKENTGKIIEAPLDQLIKRFKEGQRVKVISGLSKGKTGVILKL